MISEPYDRPISSHGGRNADIPPHHQYDYTSDDGYDEVDIDYPSYGQMEMYGQGGAAYGREVHDRPSSRGAAFGY